MLQNNTDLESQIRGFIGQHMLFGDETIEYDNDSSLLEAGIVDSIGVMELVAYVGKTYGIDVPAEDIVPENFDSISSLAAYVRLRRGSQSP